MIDSPLYSSWDNLNYTYHYDKLSCVRAMYFVHVTLAYLTTFCGAACFVCRLSNKAMWLHAHFGRAYIILMLWLMATSLVLHNTGLPIAVLISFVCVLSGITMGWACIKWHQARMERRAIEHIGRQQPNVTLTVESWHNAKREVSERVSPFDRLFSPKAAHGMLMFVSFVNILGRLGASNQSGDFVCYTYPVYKQLDSAKFNGSASQNLTLVPVHDPEYGRLPWASSDLLWGLEMSLGPLAAAFVAGAAFSYCSNPAPVSLARRSALDAVRLSVPQTKPECP